MKNILFVASECVPFVKTGGLADVVGALPKSLDRSRYDVRVVLPHYACIPARLRENFSFITSFHMQFGSLGDLYVGIFEYKLDGITYYFIDNRHYFDDPTPYGAMLWDVEKFCFFSKAALSILTVVDFRPDVIHCHDWQTGVVPVFLHEMFQDNPFYRGIRTVITIHNLRFQGVWDIKTLQRFTGFSSKVFTPDRMEFKKDANMLKGALVYADRITTVSDTYAEEIKQPFYGEGLDGLLCAKSDTLRGILNGIDYDVYNPKTDPQIYARFDATDFLRGKAENKAKLQAELGLPIKPDVMMLGMITRLTDQKGLDLIAYGMERLLGSNVQLVVIGTGDACYENLFRNYENTRHDKVSANIYFNEERAHRLYAAADAMLMPSAFEPCGLTQLISLRYGTVPIVRETGGLRDTVEAYNQFDDTGTGFSFANYSGEELIATIFRAEKVFYDNPAAWNVIVRRGMERDFSWGSSARKYEALYDELG